MSVEVVTFGCRLNAYESSLIEEQAKNSGLENTIIFNSCSVTSEAERQLRQAIRKAHRENPNTNIIVTGCAAQINPKKYADMEEVDQVIGNAEKLEKSTYQKIYFSDSEKILVNDIMSIKETASHITKEVQDKARAFLQIQNGCNHRCTFCIIPYGRGNSRSVPLGEIVKHANHLVENGYKEIVLTGVDMTDYGKDLPGKQTFSQMIKRLLGQVPNLERLRLSSVDVAELKEEEFFTLLANEKRLMPHLHLSLQAGDDLTLKRMKRRHLRRDVIEFCSRAKLVRPEVVFGADIIAGFPTETEEMFENTANLIKELNIIHLHIFPYSEREGTPAARMPQVEKKIRKERAAILRSIGENLLEKHLKSHVGKKLKVLVENGEYGHAEDFSPVHIENFPPEARGKIIECKVVGYSNKKLSGYIL